MKKLAFIISGIVFCFVGFAGTLSYAGTISPEIEAILQSAGPQERIPVIVSLSGKVDIGKFKDKSKGQRRSRIVKALKQRHEEALERSTLRGILQGLSTAGTERDRIRSLWMINSLALKARPGIIRQMAQRPGVEIVRLDQVVELPGMLPAFAAAPEWNLEAVRAKDLWDLGYTGQGVVVASVDTGVDVNHPDLVTRWRGGTNSWFDANDPDFNPVGSTPYDLDGHGTAVMGILVGGDAGGSSIGMAPGAQWIAVKIFNQMGVALESEIHAGYQWLLDPDGLPDTDDAPDIVNNSWGFAQNPGVCVEEEAGISFREDVQILKQAGIAMVFSAGNAGPLPSTSVSPGNYPESFAVGAVDENQNIADFSSRGPSACDGRVYPEVVAPGDRASAPFGIRTADLYFGIPNPYTYVIGSSFAAPHASGAMTLLLSAFPGLTPHQLEIALKLSALDLGPVGADNDYGYGQVDTLGAYDAVQAFDDVTILNVVYDPNQLRLTVVATSSTQPEAQLTAEGYGPLIWRAGIAQYTKGFNNVTVKPAEVTVVSSNGGFATYALPIDAVTINNVTYDPADQRLVVVATSSAQPDVTLTAEGYGPLIWRAGIAQYTKGFNNVTIKPAGVTVVSSGGGSAMMAVP